LPRRYLKGLAFKWFRRIGTWLLHVQLPLWPSSACVSLSARLRRPQRQSSRLCVGLPHLCADRLSADLLRRSPRASWCRCASGKAALATWTQPTFSAPELQPLSAHTQREAPLPPAPLCSCPPSCWVLLQSWTSRPIGHTCNGMGMHWPATLDAAHVCSCVWTNGGHCGGV
jgi:hypothetical protein